MCFTLCLSVFTVGLFVVDLLCFLVFSLVASCIGYFIWCFDFGLGSSCTCFILCNTSVARLIV